MITKHNGYLFQFSYSYVGIPNEHNKNCPCAQDSRSEYTKTGYFEDNSTLLDFLTRWTTNGWRYYLKPEDIIFNSRAKEITLYELENNKLRVTVPFRMKHLREIYVVLDLYL